MSTRIISTRLKLKRDTLANYETIKDTLIPLNGEILLVDTPSDGLRSKVGNGTSTFAQLPYSDQVVRDMVSGIVVQGYYYDGKFYTTAEHTIMIAAYSYKVYINRPDFSIYAYTDDDSAYHKLVDIPTATSTVAGVMKLYESTGTNTDGTMTQFSISTEIGKKFAVAAGSDEDLIFTSGLT